MLEKRSGGLDASLQAKGCHEKVSSRKKGMDLPSDIRDLAYSPNSRGVGNQDWGGPDV